MAPKQKMRLANEKHSKNVTNRGNVPKSLVSHMLSLFIENEVSIHRASGMHPLRSLVTSVLGHFGPRTDLHVHFGLRSLRSRSVPG